MALCHCRAFMLMETPAHEACTLAISGIDQMLQASTDADATPPPDDPEAFSKWAIEHNAPHSEE